MISKKPLHVGSRSVFGLVALSLSVSSCGGCGHDGAQPVAAPPPVCAVPDTTSTSFYDAVKFLFKGDCTTQKTPTRRPSRDPSSRCSAGV